MDPFLRGLSQSKGDSSCLHYTKTRAPAISPESRSRNGHVSVSGAPPMWTEDGTQPARKMGVASLLFHRTLSPKDILQVQNYTLETQRQPTTQLHVHSYAREHQPRHLQHKASAPLPSSAQAPGCEEMKPQPESEITLSKVAQNEPEAQSPVVVSEREEGQPKMSSPVEAQAEEEEKPEVAEPISKPASPLSQTQPQELDKVETEPLKNKRKVWLFFLPSHIEEIWKWSRCPQCTLQCMLCSAS